jgi:hypothetical protein
MFSEFETIAPTLRGPLREHLRVRTITTLPHPEVRAPASLEGLAAIESSILVQGNFP